MRLYQVRCSGWHYDKIPTFPVPGPNLFLFLQSLPSLKAIEVALNLRLSRNCRDISPLQISAETSKTNESHLSFLPSRGNMLGEMLCHVRLPLIFLWFMSFFFHLFRRSVLGEVLCHVRLPLVSPYFLFDKVEEEPILSSTKECRELLDEAKK